ncbi:MAG: HNH endonuclease [Acidiferrobacterales bacterium]|nr:HNH endonuclease [Acidiferrobacterales bacterium]
MTKAIFTIKQQSIYDDIPEYRYHFPNRYWKTARQSINDWIIYYEPTRGNGRGAYFAIARVDSIEQDPRRGDHHYAYVSQYLEFDQPVPFREGTFFYENELRSPDGKSNPLAFRKSIRPISDFEYTQIIGSGFNEFKIDHHQPLEVLRITPEEENENFKRRIIQEVTNRPFREIAFSRQVKKAYDNTCAVTGLKILNGGGRAEVEAAHIRPVNHNGPDSVRNGIALSKTVHWMFDRGLISIDDNFTVLVSEGSIPDSMLAMFEHDRKLREPMSKIYEPNRKYLKYHRDNIFKG